jgi:hypothetical protein
LHGDILIECRTAIPLNNARTSLWIVAGLSMGPVIALGLARFAYALLLPAMRGELGWSYADAGAMNAANAAGHLSDGPDGVRSGLELSAGILLLAAITSAFQRELPRNAVCSAEGNSQDN